MWEGRKNRGTKLYCQALVFCNSLRGPAPGYQKPLGFWHFPGRQTLLPRSPPIKNLRFWGNSVATKFVATEIRGSKVGKVDTSFGSINAHYNNMQKNIDMQNQFSFQQQIDDPNLGYGAEVL